MQATWDVFISYSSKDRSVVQPLAERLRADGLRVWFDQWEISVGDSIPAKIEDGLEHSRVLVLCMSANAFGSDWSGLESGTFRFRDPLNKDRRFIPLRLDDARAPGSLAQFRCVDWREQKREAEYQALLAACRPDALAKGSLADFASAGSGMEPDPKAHTHAYQKVISDVLNSIECQSGDARLLLRVATELSEDQSRFLMCAEAPVREVEMRTRDLLPVLLVELICNRIPNLGANRIEELLADFEREGLLSRNARRLMPSLGQTPSMSLLSDRGRILLEVVHRLHKMRTHGQLG